MRPRFLLHILSLLIVLQGIAMLLPLLTALIYQLDFGTATDGYLNILKSRNFHFLYGIIIQITYFLIRGVSGEHRVDITGSNAKK